LATSLKEAISLLEKNKLVIKISNRLSLRYEIPYIAKELEKNKAIIFENIEGHGEFKIVFGVYGDRKRLAIALGLHNEKNVYDVLLDAIKNPLPPRKTSQKFDYIIKGNEVNITSLPIPTFYEKDKGPYITAGIVIAKDPETGIRNASYHRMTPIDKNKFAVRVVERDLWQYLKKAREMAKPLEAALIIGVDPATALASATSIPIDKDEIEVANSILKGKLKLTDGQTIKVDYPSNVELVLEGRFLTTEEADEGPFTDITGTYDIVRKQPVFEVTAILYKRNPLFQAILPAGHEHRTLMGLPREAKIYQFTREVSIVHDVCLPQWGCGWMECIISIEKRHEDEPVDVGLAAFAAHPSLKKVIIVDEDINIRSCDEVYWAVITRAHPVRDYIVIPRGKGSSLDHTGKPRARIIIDATIKGDKALFERAKIRPSERAINILKNIKKE